MHRLLLASAITVALAACSDTGAVDQAAATPASIDEVELIPREALFGNPERANVQMSPDGRYLSWIAPLDGTLNVWVAPAGDLSAARAVTRDDARGIRSYFWSYLDDTLLYVRDTGGDEDFHLYAVNLASGENRDLKTHIAASPAMAVRSRFHTPNGRHATRRRPCHCMRLATCIPTTRSWRFWMRLGPSSYDSVFPTIWS